MTTSGRIASASGTQAGLGRPTIVALLVAAAQAPLGSTLIAVALPMIAAEFGADLVMTTSLLVTSYLLINVVFQGPGGKLSDVLGQGRTLRIGIGLYACGALLGLVAGSTWILALSRCAMAAAGAMVVPSTLALFRLHVAPESRGRVFGLIGATLGFSAAIGPAFGGELVRLFGWRSVFLASLPFLAFSALTLLLHPIPPSPSRRARGWGETLRSFDIAGVVLLAVSLGALIAATKVGSAWQAGLLIVAAPAGVAFIFWELRVPEPVFNPRLFRHSSFASATSIISLQNFAMYGLLFMLPQFCARVLHASPREVGYTLFSMMIGMVVSSPLGGRLTDRFGARRTALIGAIPFLLGSLLLCRLASFTSPLDVAGPLFLFGIGMGLFSAPTQSTAMSSVGPEDAGMAAGASATMRYLGAILSVLMMNVTLGSDAAATMGRYTLTVWLFGAAVMLSIVLAFRLPSADVRHTKA